MMAKLKENYYKGQTAPYSDEGHFFWRSIPLNKWPFFAEKVGMKQSCRCHAIHNAQD